MKQRTAMPNMPSVLRKVLDLAYADPRTARELGEDAGVSHQVLHNWRKNSGANVESLSAVLGALGYKLVIVPLSHDDTKERARTDRLKRIREWL